MATAPCHYTGPAAGGKDQMLEHNLAAPRRTTPRRTSPSPSAPRATNKHTSWQAKPNYLPLGVRGQQQAMSRGGAAAGRSGTKFRNSAA
eukprot:15469819-Alexandrium_andersonii.AAC.1